MAKKKRPGQLQTRYKKQHGLHHKHSGKYLKVYWPYLPVLVIVIIGVAFSISILLNKPVTPVTSASISSPAIFNKTNELRKSAGLSPLQINPQLTTAAQEKANDMAVRNYWSPISPNGQTPWQIIKTTGFQFQTAGENLAYGFSSSSQLFGAWVSSAGHKANMINKSFNNVGFGIAKTPDFQGQGPQTIVVALYGATQEAGAIIPTQKSPQSFTSASLSEPSNQTVVRAESITNSNNKITVFIAGLAIGIVGCFLILRHGLIIRKWALESEDLIVKHPFLDIALVSILIGVASLGQTIGFIR